MVQLAVKGRTQGASQGVLGHKTSTRREAQAAHVLSATPRSKGTNAPGSQRGVADTQVEEDIEAAQTSEGERENCSQKKVVLALASEAAMLESLASWSCC
jgi:hypothetical protein